MASDVAERAVNGFKMSFAEVAIESFARALADSASSAVDVVVDVVREAGGVVVHVLWRREVSVK